MSDTENCSDCCGAGSGSSTDTSPSDLSDKGRKFETIPEPEFDESMYPGSVKQLNYAMGTKSIGGTDVPLKESEQTITPWKVESVGGIDYAKLIEKFGTSRIDGELIKKIHRVTRYPVHKWLIRGLFFSQRDLEQLLDAYEKGEKIFIYTGRGPSNGMHLGHCVPFEFTKYLQDAFGAILVIQMSDDEKYYFRKEENPPKFYNDLAYENAKDIISIGFNPDKTYIFANSEEITKNPALMKNVILMLGKVKGSDIEAIFDLTTSNAKGPSNTIGQIVWPIYQSVPAFSSSFRNKLFKNDVKERPCLVAMAVDQDPYFRLTRDHAHTYRSMGFLKPSCIHSEFLVSMEGRNAKMSSTGASPTIYLSDTESEIRSKIKKFAFSGGGDSLENHRKHGANLMEDVSYQYLLYFMDDDIELERIAKEYSSGRMLTSEIKTIMTNCVVEYVKKIQAARMGVTDEVVAKFFNDDREFDDTLPVRDPIELHSDEEYAKMGINFDRYFGCLKSTKSD